MNILVVEDEPKTVDYLYRGLTEHGCTVDIGRNGVDGRHLALQNNYDAVVLDAMLPGQDGFSVLRELRAHKQTPVIMLTARGSVEDRVRGLRDGADDYLIKPFYFPELLARLHALTRRQRAQDQLQLTVGDLRIDLLSRKAYRGTRRIDLTGKEFSLLMILARREGQILSKNALAELVWEMNFDSNTNVVEVAIKRLRSKIDADSASPLLHTVRSMGYVLEVRSVDDGTDAQT